MTANPPIDSQDFCSRVNAALGQLSYSYSESSRAQSLAVDGLAQIRFCPSAGGAVGGGSDRWVRNKHLDNRIHEPGAVAALMAIRSMGYRVDTVLDVGALYGYFSFLSAAAFDEADVHALEMNPASFQALKNNIEFNAAGVGPRVKPWNCAVSDRTQKGKQVHIENFSLRHQYASYRDRALGLVKNLLGMIYFKNLSYRRCIESRIDFWTLDEFCKEAALQPGLVKIDVEGYQAHIIPGALNMLALAKPIVMLEFDSPEAVNASSWSNKDIVKPLFDMGYSLVWGRHRDPKAIFEHLRFQDMDQRHETNSLGVFLP